MTEAATNSRREYEAGVCNRLDEAQAVPFEEVFIGHWRPLVAQCHENVDRWAQSHPEYTAVRGWVTYASFGDGMFGLTAHSVVKDAGGRLFDITPLEDESLRPGMLFVPHLEDDASFHRLRQVRASHSPALSAFLMRCKPL
jgi:hypothetical protein